MAKRLDPQVIEKALRIHEEEGLSFATLAQRFGCGRNTLSDAYRRKKRQDEKREAPRG